MGDRWACLKKKLYSRVGSRLGPSVDKRKRRETNPCRLQAQQGFTEPHIVGGGGMLCLPVYNAHVTQDVGCVHFCNCSVSPHPASQWRAHKEGPVTADQGTGGCAVRQELGVCIHFPTWTTGRRLCALHRVRVCCFLGAVQRLPHGHDVHTAPMQRYRAHNNPKVMHSIASHPCASISGTAHVGCFPQTVLHRPAMQVRQTFNRRHRWQHYQGWAVPESAGC